MSAKLKIHLDNVSSAFMLYDDVISDINDDMNINLDVTAEDLAELGQLSVDFWNVMIYGNDTIRKAASTELFREWRDIINAVVDNDNNKNPYGIRLAIYSSDRSIMIPIILGLGQTYNEPIKFGENVVI